MQVHIRYAPIIWKFALEKRKEIGPKFPVLLYCNLQFIDVLHYNKYELL